MTTAADLEYVTELLTIRDSYLAATPRQRLSIIRQRIANPGAGPNRLVTAVSAVEALARTLCLHQKARSRNELRKLYGRYKDRDPKTLVQEYLKSKSVSAPEDHFGAETWRLFKHAVDYRNLLVHECSFLGQDKYPQLILACEAVLDNLAKLGHVPERGA